jgi:hypothetical protein
MDPWHPANGQGNASDPDETCMDPLGMSCNTPSRVWARCSVVQTMNAKQVLAQSDSATYLRSCSTVFADVRRVVVLREIVTNGKACLIAQVAIVAAP